MAVFLQMTFLRAFSENFCILTEIAQIYVSKDPV